MSDYLSPKLKEILNRSESNKTYSNYSDAVDQNTWIGTLDDPRIRVTSASIPIGLPITIFGGKIGDTVVQAADYLSNLIYGKKEIPTAQSNCTLTASLWINPNIPISRAETIINDGNKYGYTEIPENYALPGDLIIATNPNNNTHHTMLLTGFTKNPLKHTFMNKEYLLPKLHPLVRYSNGTTHPSGYRKSVGLIEYLDISEGKSDVKYYRYHEPGTIETLLPEVVVTPTKTYIPEGLKTITIY